MSLTVACVWVNGHVPFTVEYVQKLHAMCHRWIGQPFRFVCLTDRPWLLPDDIDRVVVPAPGKLFGWWRKLELFNSEHGFEGRMLYLDLDTLIVAPLDPVVSYPSEFALVPHAGTFEGKRGLAVVKRFNSSVMVFDAGRHMDYLYRLWSPAVAQHIWGDQDFIGQHAREATTMPAAWFPRLSDLRWPDRSTEAKVILCKKPKNAVAVKTLRGFAEAWG